jgi:hypothetical protein
MVGVWDFGVIGGPFWLRFPLAHIIGPARSAKKQKQKSQKEHREPFGAFF